MAQISLSEIKSRIRQRTRDKGTFIQKVIPIGICDGVNKLYQVPLAPFDADTFKVYQSDSLVTASAYALDADTGELSFTTAPISGAKQSCSFSYYIHSDTDVADAIHRAEQQLRGTWDLTYTFSGSGDSETFVNAPTETIAEVFILYGCILLLKAELLDISRRAERPRDLTGSRDSTVRLDALKERMGEFFQEVSQVLRGLGYLGSIQIIEHDYGIVYDDSWIYHND